MCVCGVPVTSAILALPLASSQIHSSQTAGFWITAGDILACLSVCLSGCLSISSGRLPVWDWLPNSSETSSASERTLPRGKSSPLSICRINKTNCLPITNTNPCSSVTARHCSACQAGPGRCMAEQMGAKARGAAVTSRYDSSKRLLLQLY